MKEQRPCGDTGILCSEACRVRHWRAAFTPFLLTFAAAFPCLVASIEQRIEEAIARQRLVAVDDPHNEVRVVLYFANGVYGRIAERIGLLYDCVSLPPVLLEDGRCKVETFVGAVAYMDHRLSRHLQVQPCLPVSLLAPLGDVLPCEEMPVPDGPSDEESFLPKGAHPLVILASRASAGRISNALSTQYFHRYLLAEVFPGEWAICLEDEKDQAFVSMIVSAHHVTVQLCRDAPSQLQSTQQKKSLMSSKLVEVQPANRHSLSKRQSTSPPLATANPFSLLSQLEL